MGNDPFVDYGSLTQPIGSDPFVDYGNRGANLNSTTTAKNLKTIPAPNKGRASSTSVGLTPSIHD